MRQLLSNIWNYDFTNSSEHALKVMGWLALAFLIMFGVYDLLFDTGAGYYGLLTGYLSKHENPLSAYMGYDAFRLLTLVVLGGLFVYITAFGALSFYVTIKRYNYRNFMRIFFAHFLSNIVALLFTIAFFALLGALAHAAGFTYQQGSNAIQNGFKWIEDFIKSYVPTLVNTPYPVALVLGLVLGALPGYITHWFGHHSRLVWYASHRCHHTAEIMHAAGIGPFMFLPELFGAIPAIFFSAVCTKLFFHEPLLFETLALSLLGILTEKFNHTTAFYKFAYSNPLVRGLSAYFGNGVYHYMHHTSKEGEEIINVGGSPFLIWDRLFGTYRIPTKELPTVGLTNNPIIKLSPFAIMFSGFQQIAYELKHNKDFKTRFWILFGSVYYKPPVSKDYLILGYPDK